MTFPMVSRVGRGVLNHLKVTAVRCSSSSSSHGASEDVVPFVLSAESETVFQREDKFGAHNYHSLPVVLNRGKGDI